MVPSAMADGFTDGRSNWRKHISILIRIEFGYHQPAQLLMPKFAISPTSAHVDITRLPECGELSG